MMYANLPSVHIKQKIYVPMLAPRLTLAEALKYEAQGDYVKIPKLLMPI